MPKSKRKTAARKSMPAQDTSDLDFPESSPSRRSAKRRKVTIQRNTNSFTLSDDNQVNGTRSSTRRRASPEVEDELPSFPDSADESDNASQSDLIETVISNLNVSKDPVAATIQHSNELITDTSKINAYAKIAARSWTYFVREQSINIGRPPDDRQLPENIGASSPLTDLKEMMPVHIDLGPSKIVSRHHCSIFYDSEVPENGGWHVRVNGRNGVRVNNVMLKRGGRQQITSGTVLEIAGTQMMFVTANDAVQIASYFLDQAKNTAEGDEIAPTSHAYPEPTQMSSTSYPSLAPAPPDFKRAATPPPSNDMRNQRAVFDTKNTMSPIYGRGLMMESTQEIDYARDSAKDLKPPFSYANMIAQAIFSSDEEKLTLSNIYSFIAEKYAFYRHSNSGWQNSIRHNLSLNKAFQKVPRRTDEPGKGMKWQIAPEFRAEYYKKHQAKRHGSAPSSPASSKEINPNFRGPNGQNLGYDTSMVSSFSTKDAPQPNRPTWQPNAPPQGYPPQHQLAPPSHPQDATSTPIRRRADTGTTQPDIFTEDSPMPLPPHRGRANGQQQTYTLPPSHHNPRSPPPGNLHQTFSSSYLDTPFHPSQSSLITPAPLRQNPRLAPPSTLVAPSKFMPESSPAGPGLFWKGIMGVTPGPVPQDFSPVKSEPLNRVNGRDIDRQVMSSSPPPMDGIGSPSKMGRSSQLPTSAMKEGSAEFSGKDRDGDSTMRSRSASAAQDHTQNGGQIQDSTQSFGASNGNGNAGGRASLAPPATLNLIPNPAAKSQQANEDDDDRDGGFDLAKGFAPIASGLKSGRTSVVGR